MSKTSHLLSKQNSQQPKQFRGGEKKVMKKSLSLLVAIAMVFSMFATLVSADEKTAGEKLEGYGIIKGTSNGLEEDAEWKRQDVTVLIARLLGKEAEAKATANTHGFADVDSKFYNGFISWAKANDYFKGQSDTKFGVGESITNQEFAQVLLRVLGLKEVPYAEVFEKAVELKLVSADLVKTDNAIRGDIYTTLVTALDYEIDGKKLGTILGLEGYKITDVAVVGASASNSKTVNVEFNQEIGAVLASNFVVKNKETESVEVISTVSVSGKVATLTLFDSLAKDKTYVVEATGVTSKDASATQPKAETAEFSYVKTAAASIEIPKTVVAKNDAVNYVIKDAKGNDITVDFNLDEVITANSSDESIVDVNGVELKASATNTGFSVVNVVLTIDEDTTFETGNKVIEVKDSVAVVNGIGKVSFNNDFNKDADTSLFKNSENKKLFAQILDASGKELALAAEDVVFKSANPTVLVVDETGLAFPVKAGSATVTVTAKFNGKTVSKSVVITVKAEAKLAGVDVDKSSVKLVLGAEYADGSAITETVKVTAKDQFGDALKAAGQVVTVKASKNGVVTANGEAVHSGIISSTSTPLVDFQTNADGVVELVFAINPAITDATSTSITVQAGSFKKTITVSVVKPAALSGYVAELSATKIDLSNATTDTDSNAINDKNATVRVYQKDVNGNKIAEITAGVVVTDADNNAQNKGAVNVNGTTITPYAAGTETVTVTVNGVKVGTYTITVVNTGKHLNKVVQSKNAITTTGDLVADLFGTNENGGAFVAYDQYGEKIAFAAGDYVAYSSNKAVVGNDLTTGTAGTALVTIVVNDAVYTITVKVN